MLRVTSSSVRQNVTTSQVMIQAGHIAEAEQFIRGAPAQDPANLEYLAVLANLLLCQTRMDDLTNCCRHMVTLAPHDPTHHFNLAFSIRDGMLLDEKLAGFERALQANPNFHAARSAILYLLHFHPTVDGPALLARHRQWNDQIAARITPMQAFPNDRSPNRPLRIGYVSQDFRDHVVGRFMLPLLTHHDRTQCEVFAYASVPTPDAMTDQLRRAAHHWRSIAGIPDEQAAEMIRADGIDILVDLIQHMGGSRLLLFARRPAPIQVTYLGYAGTTGLRTMDYRITDPLLDPPGSSTDCYSEKNAHIPSYWCYAVPPNAPDPAPPPSLARGTVTFGSLNSGLKHSRPVLEAWAAILQKAPDSRLLLHTMSPAHAERVTQLFASHGIASHRLAFSPMLSMDAYFAKYYEIDIALDPFPYAGGTTSCDALYMGVPLVTLRGRTAVGRGGVSILAQLGLSAFVAETAEDYIRIATTLAADRPRLADLRAALRPRMTASRLMDAPAFARCMEESFRTMWHTWCTDAPAA